MVLDDIVPTGFLVTKKENGADLCVMQTGELDFSDAFSRVGERPTFHKTTTVYPRQGWYSYL